MSTPQHATGVSPASPTEPSAVLVREGDLHSPADQQCVLELLELYARALPGCQRPLPTAVTENLITALQSQSGCHLFLAEACARVVGLAICFDGFSTFQAKPLLNLHDLTIHNDFQGKGIGDQLLGAVIRFARQASYCAVTLEVKADNPARRLYARHGFAPLSGECDGQLSLFAKLEFPATDW